MSQPSGMHMLDCRYCGKRYLRTNYMRRHKHPERDHKGHLLNDTHLIACYRKTQKAQGK